MQVLRQISNFRKWIRGTHADYRAVFSSPAGERVLADMWDRAAPNGIVDVPGDPQQTLRLVYRKAFVEDIARFAGMTEAQLEDRLSKMKKENGYADQEPGPDEDDDA